VAPSRRKATPFRLNLPGCERRGQYRKASLIERYGPDKSMVELRLETRRAEHNGEDDTERPLARRRHRLLLDFRLDGRELLRAHHSRTLAAWQLRLEAQAGGDVGDPPNQVPVAVGRKMAPVNVCVFVDIHRVDPIVELTA
jgi:hypothetical protein